MTFIIREAQKEDMSSVLKLITELAVFEREPEAVIVTVEDLVNYGFKKEPAFFTFVAEDAGVIVGMALFYYRFSTWKGVTIHLEDLIVTQSHRGRGIGKALYDKVLEVAYKKGLKRVEWAVLDWNTPAIKFYESTGAMIQKDWRVCQMTDAGLKNYLESK